MLSRFDSLSSISGSNQTQAECNDYLPIVKGQGQKLTRTFTEDFQEAYRNISALHPGPSARAEPSISQIVEELSPYEHVLQDDEEWPEDEQPGPLVLPGSSSQVVRATNPAVALARMPSFPRYIGHSQSRLSIQASFSNPLAQIPITSPLETAPPPDFSSMALSQPEQPFYPVQHTFMEDEEDDVEIAPLPLSDLIHMREDTPTPSGPPPRAALRKASTNPALHAAPVPPRTPARGASASNVATRSPPSAVRRSQRLQNKVGDSSRANEEASGYSPYSSSRRSLRK